MTMTHRQTEPLTNTGLFQLFWFEFYILKNENNMNNQIDLEV